MATWSKLFTNFAWKNRPDTSTPLGQTLLNRLNNAINGIDDRVVTLNTQKVSTDEIQGVFTDVRLIKNTGQFVFTLFDGTEKIIDTALEKISINVRFDQATQMMVLEKEDGSIEYVDLSVFTTQYEFVSSPTIQQTVTDGKVSAEIKLNSITDQMLQTNYLADITTQANTAVSASQSALESQSLAEQHAEEADSQADRAKREADRAEEAADRAEAITGITVDTTLDTNSSNPIANKAVVGGLNTIQSTSKGTLSTAGWYRVAEYNGGTYSVGTNSNSCVLTVKQCHDTKNGESHVLRLLSVSGGNQEIVSIASKCRNDTNRTITKARYTYDSNNAYLEIYYAQSVNNDVSFTISDGTDRRKQWQAITPTLTSETVDGVTVTTTYDIPANASPVTDLDLFSNVKNYANLDFDTLVTTKMYTASGIPSALGATNYPTDKTGLLIVEGKAVVSQKYITYNGEIYERSKLNVSGRTWSEWKRTATTADLTAELAKYFPLTGGTIDGNIDQIVTTDTFVRHKLRNTARNIDHVIYANGDFVQYDNTNNKAVYTSKADGTNAFNGTANGNVASVDGTAYLASHGGFTIQRTGGAVCTPKYVGNGNLLGYLGFSEADKPIFIDTNGSYRDILHTGNITDYVAADSETGTFTLKLNGVTLGTGTYYKVGKLVHCRATGNFPQEFEAGYISLTGFPFANASLDSSVADFHVHQYYGKAADNMVFDITPTEIAIQISSTIPQNQPFVFSAIYFTA